MARIKAAILCSCLLISFILLLPFHLFGEGTDLPMAPQGYSWRRFDRVQSSFLVPEGWFVKEETRGETVGIFISKESIEKAQGFKTGFTANLVRDFGSKNKVLPSGYARSYIAQQVSLPTTLRSWGGGPVGGGPLKGYGAFVRFRSTKTGGVFIGQILALGNDRTGTLYLFAFEAPEPDWDKASEVGATIMDNLALDPEF